MTKRQRYFGGLLLFILGMAAFSTTAAFQSASGRAPAQSAPAFAGTGPRYAGDGALMLPDDYRQWVFIGSSLGLSYSSGQPGMEMFHETLMEPTAYKLQNDTCLMVPGTAVDPALFAVHDKRIYAFAASQCVEEFKKRPAEFVKSQKAQ